MPSQKMPSLAVVEKELVRRNGLHEFIRLSWHLLEPTTPFIDNWHIQAMAEHVEALYRGDIQRLLINVPPRTLKSLTCSVFAPAWAWIWRPSLRMIFASYSERLSIGDSVKTRQIIESSWYQERWGNVFRLSEDQNTLTNFENTGTGMRYATSVGGTVVGKGADIITCDDLLSKDQAESQVFRDRGSRFRFEVLPSRFNDRLTGRSLDIQQRLHPQDTSGELLERERDGRVGNLVKLILPMEYVPTTYVTVLGFKDPRTMENEGLHPQRFPEHVIQDLKNDLSSYAYSGQYQQTPVPREGGMIKESWFKNRFDCDLTFDNLNKRPGLLEIVESSDCASKSKTRSDPTVWGVFGVFKDHVELWNVKRARVEFPTGLRMFKDRALYWMQETELIEDKDSGQQYIQQLRDSKDYRVTIVESKPEGLDKGTRMAAETALIERGDLWIPENAPWLSDFLTELCLFTGNNTGGHDDQCFVAGTRIATEFGDVSIEKIDRGTHVITPFGLSEVLDIVQIEEKEVISNCGLVGTKDHPILCVDGKKSLDMVYESVLQLFSWNTLKHYTVLKQLFLKELPFDSWEVRDATISVNQKATQEDEIQKVYMSLFGNMSTIKRFVKVLRFTTRMIIHLIIARKIWNVYQEANIKKFQTTGLKKVLNTWKKLGIWLQSGIEVLKEELGILKCLLDPGQRISPIFVKIVQKNLNPILEKQTFVPAIVDGNFGITKKVSVYNLKTSHGVYFANGILVSNCDMVSYFLKWYRKKYKKRRTYGAAGEEQVSTHTILTGTESSDDY